ncbi:hypothetical protein [Chryseobacterium sp. Mn2064]|uniref:hypothetical protein n=1 Tax=Chryseobacterium sp. Mn2064 TaxID=3395263 RepID=UPI003BE04B53
MVHFKIIIQFLLLSVIVICCNTKSISEELHINPNNALKIEEYEKQFCFGKIYRLVNKSPLKSTKYYKVDTIKVYEFLENNRNEQAVSKFQDFVSYTTDTNFYLLLNEKQNVIIAIGKASGASALGADYWNYLCYSIPDKKEIKFGSLINSPFSLFPSNNILNYIEVMDNIPRPANGEIINLNYTPLIIDSYNLDKQQLSHMEMNCNQ